MAEVLLASENAGKLKELKELIGSKLVCVTPLDGNISKKHALLVEEDGQTYYENALKKALAYYKSFRLPVLADDSGLEVDPLNGAPGVFTATYGGEKASWPDRWKHLHAALAPFPPDTWRARFRCVLCYYDGTRVPAFFEGTVEGKILPVALGSAGFGYDPVFYSSALKKGFAEASSEEKNQHSHRAVAVRQFLDWFGRR